MTVQELRKILKDYAGEVEIFSMDYKPINLIEIDNELIITDMEVVQ